jgi:uncharacterized protein (TIGR03437 family)
MCRSVLWAALCSVATLLAADPAYTVSSLLNAASGESGPFSPNTIVSLYGQGLSYETVSLGGADGSYLPEHLQGAGTYVLVNSQPAGLFYVSPTQVNFLLSSGALPGPAIVQVVRDGLAGPPVTIHLSEASPGLFQLDPDYVIATRPDGSVITPKNPAAGGEIVILYATGLGRTAPLPADREIPSEAAPLTRLAEFQVVIDGKPLPAADVLYAGVAPRFAGLYQLNVRLPGVLGPDPEITVGYAGAMSAFGVRLPAR